MDLVRISSGITGYLVSDSKEARRRLRKGRRDFAVSWYTFVLISGGLPGLIGVLHDCILDSRVARA